MTPLYWVVAGSPFARDSPEMTTRPRSSRRRTIGLQFRCLLFTTLLDIWLCTAACTKVEGEVVVAVVVALWDRVTITTSGRYATGSNVELDREVERELRVEWNGERKRETDALQWETRKDFLVKPHTLPAIVIQWKLLKALQDMLKRRMSWFVLLNLWIHNCPSIFYLPSGHQYHLHCSRVIQKYCCTRHGTRCCP